MRKLQNDTVTESSLNHYFNFKDKINEPLNRSIVLDTGLYGNIEFQLVKFGFNVVTSEYQNINIITPYLSINDSLNSSLNSYVSIETIDNSYSDSIQILGRNNITIFTWVNFQINDDDQNTQYIFNLNNETTETGTDKINKFTMYLYTTSTTDKYYIQFDLYYETFGSNFINILTDLNLQLQQAGKSINLREWYNIVITSDDFDYKSTNSVEENYLRINVYINGKLEASTKIPNHTGFYKLVNNNTGVSEITPCDSSGNLIGVNNFNKQGFGLSNYENNFIGRGMNADAFNNTGITNLFISQFAFINETLNPFLIKILYNNGYTWNLKKNLNYSLTNFGKTQVNIGDIVFNNNAEGDIHDYNERIYPSNGFLTFSNNSLSNF